GTPMNARSIAGVSRARCAVLPRSCDVRRSPSPGQAGGPVTRLDCVNFGGDSRRTTIPVSAVELRDAVQADGDRVPAACGRYCVVLELDQVSPRVVRRQT